ncbi:MAG: hypothetical protein V1856_01550 [Candidatus Liptonbacteria bacterium]
MDIRLILTFLPIYGIALTFIFAAIFSGLKRWLILFLVPLATLHIFYAVLNYVLFNGNLLGGVMLGMYMLYLVFYYPILVIVLLVVWLKNRKRTNPTGLGGPASKSPEG